MHTGTVFQWKRKKSIMQCFLISTEIISAGHVTSCYKATLESCLPQTGVPTNGGILTSLKKSVTPFAFLFLFASI